MAATTALLPFPPFKRGFKDVKCVSYFVDALEFIGATEQTTICVHGAGFIEVSNFVAARQKVVAAICGGKEGQFYAGYCCLVKEISL